MKKVKGVDPLNNTNQDKKKTTDNYRFKKKKKKAYIFKRGKWHQNT